MFEGRESLSNMSADIRQNVSLPRRCVRLADQEVRGNFNLTERPAGASAVFRIRGMWDMYQELSELLLNAVSLMDTSGVFEVVLNERVIYHGRITFWNYRRWRFWPSIDIQFSADILKTGGNIFTIRNHTRAFKKLKQDTPVPDRYLSNTAYQISDVQILLGDTGNPPAAQTLPDDTFLGHMIGGHDVVHLEKEDYSHAVDLFTRSRQGNLIVFLMNPGKTSFDIDLDLVDTASIIRSGLHVALRYYGDNKGATIPERQYVDKLKSFVTRLGKNFLGFGPHEQHGFMSRIIQENSSATDISVYSRAYIDLFAQRVERIRGINRDALIWDTDPSFYSHFHMTAGASLPAVEFCVQNASLDIASARGAAKAFGKPRWAAINSFECQAYGGLQTLDREADADPLFERRRRDLWWLTQHLLYLGGARIMYSESGMFDHRVTLQKEFDDKHLCDLRADHEAAVDFARIHRLHGQPIACIAYLQGGYDIYKGGVFAASQVEAMGNSLYSWKNLEVCFPGVKRHVPAKENCDVFNVDKLAMVSDTPYGEADILPVAANTEVMGEYKILIASGWHTMDTPLLEKLESYVLRGGTLALLLPQLTTGTTKIDPCAHIDPAWLERLCGVKFSGQQEKDTPLTGIRLSQNLKKDLFPSLRAYLRRKETNRNDSATLMKKIITPKDGVSVIAEDEKSGLPFLLEKKLGDGSVFLFNIADFPSREQTYQCINAALADIIDSTSFDVRLKQGAHINYYLYSMNSQRGEFRLFILNNDWFDTENATQAVFQFDGRDHCFEVPKRQVIVADLSPEKSRLLDRE